MTVSFCGHSEIYGDEELRRWLEEVVEDLITQGADLFYLGGYGGFDRMAASAVWKLKKQYPNVESVLVLPYLDRKINADIYDRTTYPPLEHVPRRFCISRRNEWMVDQADVIVAYVACAWGGTANTLAYAKRKKKYITNYWDAHIAMSIP